ncbi:MAG: NirA family protein [Betaproteobacteria bacterium]
MSDMNEFTAEQKKYLEGFASGIGIGIARLGGAGGVGAKVPATTSPAGPESIHDEARARTVAAGGKLVAEEKAKAAKHPFEMWDEMRANAAEGKFPKGTDVFLYKYHGMFHVAPAQDSFMCRLRIPGGILRDFQLRGIADIAEKFAGPYAHVTTRANLQLREIPPANPLQVLMALDEIGLTSKGSGADNIRNVTGSPTAGIDAQELIDTQPLCREMHHYILNHREMYGLPRKFNIAFDGGGKVAALDDTNDIGFFAVKVGEGKSSPPGIYFRLRLGGITGHHDFAKDEGVILSPAHCVPVAEAIVRVFIQEGDRTNRQKARMKYVLDRIGHEEYLKRVEALLPFKLNRLAKEDCEPRPAIAKHGHVDFHAQKQAGKYYVGVITPVGRMDCAQMRGIADIAAQFGSGVIRLTVWQNLIISDIDEKNIGAVKSAIEALGLEWKSHSIRAGLIACTGNTGCKFAAGDTKGHALQIAAHVERAVAMPMLINTPINIHLTGCHHSCAQHYIGDIGLIAAKVDAGGGSGEGNDEQVEGYHIHVGGGYGEEQAMARPLFQDVKAVDAPQVIEKMLAGYLRHRRDADESFHHFSNRHDETVLRQLLSAEN